MGKVHYLSKLSLVFALIAVLPYPFLLIPNESPLYLSFLMSLGTLAGYAAWCGILVGTFAIHKVRKERLEGLKVALTGTIVSALVLVVSFIAAIVSSSEP